MSLVKGKLITADVSLYVHKNMYWIKEQKILLVTSYLKKTPPPQYFVAFLMIFLRLFNTCAQGPIKPSRLSRANLFFHILM